MSWLLDNAWWVIGVGAIAGAYVAIATGPKQ